MAQQPCLGNLWRWTFSFTKAGVLTDPDGTVSAIVRNPHNVWTTVAVGGLVHAGTGIYTLDTVLDTVGLWKAQGQDIGGSTQCVDWMQQECYPDIGQF